MILGILIFSSTDAAEIRHVYLTWQNDPCRSMTINIHGLKTPQNLTVYYDKEPRFSKISEYKHRKTAKGSTVSGLSDERKIYSIELLDLEPGSTYYFAIGDTLHAFGKEQSFKTIPNHSRLFFVEGGDWENTQEGAFLAKRAASLNPQAILLGGDYPTNVRSLKDYKKWDQWLDGYEENMVDNEDCLIPMVMAMGNHEVTTEGKKNAPFFLRYFPQGNTGKSFFSLPFGEKVHLFVLDSGHLESHEGQQLAWLSQELEKNKKVPIKIALYHVPLFPSVRFAEQDTFFRFSQSIVERWKSKKMAKSLFSQESNKGRTFWMPLFDRYNLTVAFEHHDQTLKRTKLLKNAKEDSEGTLYLGDGGWGSKLQYPPIQGLFYNYFAALRGKVHFFWTVEIDQENKRITYNAISIKGEILDQFVQFVK